MAIRETYSFIDSKILRAKLLHSVHKRKLSLELVLSDHSLLVPLLPKAFHPYLHLSKYFLLGTSDVNAYVISSEVLARCLLMLVLLEINEYERATGKHFQCQSKSAIAHEATLSTSQRLERVLREIPRLHHMQSRPQADLSEMRNAVYYNAVGRIYLQMDMKEEAMKMLEQAFDLARSPLGNPAIWLKSWLEHEKAVVGIAALLGSLLLAGTVAATYQYLKSLSPTPKLRMRRQGGLLPIYSDPTP